jgi:hypothetical protein
MARMPSFDPIEYLVSRRFPTWKLFSVAQHKSVESEGEVKEKARAYEKELRIKTPDEINDLVKTERAAEAEQYRRRQEAEENARFFNQPYARADFTHWGKLSYWTLDEAVALSFGKAPESVNWKAIESIASVSPFAFQYKRRRELSLRAKHSSELYDPVLPGFFLAWAKRLDWGIPTELEAIVVARGGEIGDWKTVYENEKDAHAKTMEWAKAQMDEAIKFADQQQTQALQLGKQYQEEAFEIGRQAVAERDAEIARLQEALRAAEERINVADAQTVKLPSPDPGPRERESMLRLIIGMAIQGYKYAPAAAKNSAVREIADDLHLLGIGLDEDTVRKYLQEAKDLLPPKTE